MNEMNSDADSLSGNSRCFWSLNLESQQLSLSQSFLSQLGRDQERPVDSVDAFVECLSPDFRDPFCEFLSSFSTEQGPFSIRLECNTPEGVSRVELEADTVFGPDGRPAEVYGSALFRKTAGLKAPVQGMTPLNCEEALAEISEIALVGWWEVDFDTNRVYWSERSKQIHEVPLDFEPTFADALDFYYEEDRPSIVAAIETARNRGEEYTFTGRMITAKKNAKWTKSIGKPLFRDGRCVGMRGVVQDVTAEKSAEMAVREKDDRLKRALAFAQTGFFEWNLETDEVYWDRGCCMINGLGDEELRLHISEVRTNIHEEDIDAWNEGLGQLTEVGDVFESEHRIVDASGEARWVYVRAEIVESLDGVRRMVGMATDVNDRRQAEIELQKAKEAADRANRAKSEFLAMMNHELRTPLSTIIGPCELALQIADDPEVCRFLELSMESGRHLLDLINRVLDLARIESNDLERADQRIEIRPFLRDFLKPLAGIAMRKGQSLLIEFDCDQEVALDPVIVRQVLYNLVGNAIKYCDGGQVKVVVRQDSGVLIVDVIDDGPGISERDKERIFNEFQRLPGSGIERVEGSGLGLAICRRLADLIEGSLQVDSTLGKGSTFTFRMPLGELPELNEPDTQDLSDVLKERISEGSLPRVMLVDDNAPNREFLEALLRSMGLSYDTCTTGEEAVEKFEKGVHMIVLMDIFMPGMSGEEAADAIRRRAGDSPVYIIAQTAGVSNEHREQLLKNGIDDFVPKPIPLPKLNEAIYRGLNAIRAQ